MQISNMKFWTVFTFLFKVILKSFLATSLWVLFKYLFKYNNVERNIFEDFINKLQTNGNCQYWMTRQSSRKYAWNRSKNSMEKYEAIIL